MSLKIQELHTKSATSHKEAAKHHEAAAKHVAAGEHEAAAHHAQCAQGHLTAAVQHVEDVAKTHLEEHGQK